MNITLPKATALWKLAKPPNSVGNYVYANRTAAMEIPVADQMQHFASRAGAMFGTAAGLRTRSYKSENLASSMAPIPVGDFVSLPSVAIAGAITLAARTVLGLGWGASAVIGVGAAFITGKL